MSELKDELRQLADEAARGAKPLPVADVIRRGDRRYRRPITPGRARAPGFVTQAKPGRRWPGWVAPLAAASGVILAVGLAVVLSSQVHRAGQPARADDGRAETAYVFNGNQGTVTPISPVTGKLGKPVRVGPRGYWIGHGKRRVQDGRIAQDLILPDGTTNYALYFNGHDISSTESLRRTSLVTGAAGRPIQLGHRAQQMVITPDGRTAYVTYFSGTTSTIRPVSLATGTVGKPILRVARADSPWITPWITPNGRTIYVLYLRQGTVTPISTATNIPGTPIPVPRAFSLVFTPDGRTAFVLGAGGGDAGTVTPISTATNTPGRTITIRPYEENLAFTPDGKTVYAVNNAGTSVTPISIRTGRPGKPIALHGNRGVGGTAITPDGRTLYVAGFHANRVTPISLATNTAGKPLNVPGAPLNIVMTPDGRNAYTFSAEVGPQVVTPISTATNTAGKPIRTAGPTVVLIPGDQNTP